MIWAMIGKLSEVTPDGASEEQQERPHRCSHMAYTSHPAPERTHHPSFHCSAPCPYPLWAVTLCSPCLEFRASLRSSHSTQQQSSEQDTENHSSLHSHSELGERHPEDATSLSDWQVCLWRPWLASGSHPSSRLKCASCPGPHLFQISGVVCTTLAFEPVPKEDSHPSQPSGRTQHSCGALGYAQTGWSSVELRSKPWEGDNSLDKECINSLMLLELRLLPKLPSPTPTPATTSEARLKVR